MHYFIEDKKNSKKYASFSEQAGVSSLLFIVLVGLSLTVLTVGYMSSMRNLQSSAITTHAQTQAQMQAMIGYHALTEYLNKLSKESNGLQKIDQVCDGEIKETDKDAQIIFERVGACNNSVVGQQFIFDITGKSGGASAILRANFKIVDEVKASSHQGSIFAGGLTVQNENTLQALTEGVSITVGTNGSREAGKVYKNNGDIVNYTDIKVNKYEGGLILVGVNELKSYANYVFTHSNTSITCVKQNINTINNGTTFTCPVRSGNGANAINQGLYFDSGGNSNHWVVDVQKLNANGFKFNGVLWFDGDVVLKVPDSTSNSNNYWKNTILTTGSLSIEKDDPSSAGILNIFSPYDYVIATDVTFKIFDVEKRLKNAITAQDSTLIQSLTTEKQSLEILRLSTLKMRLKEICPVFSSPAKEYPTNLCEPNFSEANIDDISSYQSFLDNSTKYLKDISKYPTNLFNMIGMADFGFSVYAHEGTQTKLYGNLIGSKAAGNTGNASGKFVGNGKIEVLGNLVVADGMDLTEMLGNVSIKLGNTKSNGNYLPVRDKSFTINGIRYM